MSIQGFNDAVSIIVDSALDKRKFDTTITCEIITVPSESATDQTYYVVESDKMRFGAYSDGSKYRVGDTVNVLIPGGDYNNRKTIMNKLTTVDEIPETSDVLHNSDGFAAVWYKNSIEIGLPIPGPDRRIHIFPNKQLQIKLTADVQSSSEDFTVKCEITGKTIENKNITVSCSWYSDDMIGNVSKFAFPFYQEIILTNKDLLKLNTIKNITITQTDSPVLLFNLSFAIGYFKEDLEDGLYIISTNGKYTYTEDVLARNDLELIWIDGGKLKNQNINIELNGNQYNINGEIWLDTTGDYMINHTRLIQYGAKIGGNTAIVPELYYNMCKGLKVGSKEEDDDTFITYNEVSYDIDDDLVSIPNTNEYMYILQGGIYTYEEGYVNDLTNPLPLYKTHWKQQGKINEIIMRKNFADSTIKAIIRNDNKTTKAEVNLTLTNSSWNSESAAVGQPDYLTLAAPKTYYPVYNNYGSMVDTTLKTVSATRSDGQAFDLKYITWKFDLTKLMKFPYHPTKKDNGSWEWYPKLPEGAIVRWEQDGVIMDITSLDGWDEEKLLNIGVGYLTLPISEPARPQSISFYFKSKLDVGNKATLTAYVHNNDNIVTAYSGTIIFTFGFVDTFGTGYSFNIISNNEYESFSGLPSSGEKKEFEAILTTPMGEAVNLSLVSNQLRWYWLHETVHSEIIDDNKKPFELLSILPIVDSAEMYYRIFLESQIVNGLYTYNSEMGEYVNVVGMAPGGDYYTKKTVAIGNKCKVIGTDNTNKEKFNYHILVAELRNWPLADGRLVTLKAYRPMILSTLGDVNLNDILGSTYMIYDTMGNKVSMNDEGLKYSILDELVNPFIAKLKRNNGKLESIEATEIKIENGVMKQPEMNPTSDGSIFTLGLSDLSNITRWIKIPLMITTNAWFSERINNWDGSVKIDTEDNYILSAMVGAGKKNSDNQFTGVIMGEVGKDLRNAESGIYGFKNGLRTFSVSAETGNAYFSGEIIARSGMIGGWLIGSDEQSLYYYLYNRLNDTTENDLQEIKYESGIINTSRIINDNSNFDAFIYSDYKVDNENTPIYEDPNWQDKTDFYITKSGNIISKKLCNINGIQFDLGTGAHIESNEEIQRTTSGTNFITTAATILHYYNSYSHRGHTTWNKSTNQFTTYRDQSGQTFNWYNYVYGGNNGTAVSGSIEITGVKGKYEIFLTNNDLPSSGDWWNDIANNGSIIHTSAQHFETLSFNLGEAKYKYLIINTNTSTNLISVKCTSDTTTSQPSSSIKYKNSWKLLQNGECYFGPWSFDGFGLWGQSGKNKKYSWDIVLRPEGVYRRNNEDTFDLVFAWPDKEGDTTS